MTNEQTLEDHSELVVSNFHFVNEITLSCGLGVIAVVRAVCVSLGGALGFRVWLSGLECLPEESAPARREGKGFARVLALWAG